MNTKMKLKNILTISLVVLLSACTHPNNDVPTQVANGDGYDNQYYQNPPITTTASYGKPVVVNNYYYRAKPKVSVSRYKRK